MCGLLNKWECYIERCNQIYFSCDNLKRGRYNCSMRIFDFGLLRLHGLFLVILVSLIGCATYVDLPVLEEQAYEINKGVMCPVCPGESIDQSQHPLAAQMRAIVANKLEQGWDEDAIKGFFVERYGPSVLLEPPTSGVNIWVWLVPPMVMLLAIGSVLLIFTRISSGGNLHDEITHPSDQDQNLINRVEFVLEREGIVPVTKNSDSEQV